MKRRTFLHGAGGALLVAGAGFGQAHGQTRGGRWLRLESTNFVVYSSDSERASREELAALEAFHRALQFIMSRQQSSQYKLRVYIAGSNSDFNEIKRGLGSSVAGYYQWHIEAVRAVTSPASALEKQRDMRLNVRAMDHRVILFHEYVHHFMAAYDRRSYPAWYREGFAEYLSTLDFTGGGIEIGKFTRNRAAWLLNGSRMGINRFLTAQPHTLTSSESAMYYAQSWLTTHYLFSNPERMEGFDTYLTALRTGGDPIESFQPAFGVTPSRFDGELRSYARGRLAIRVLGGIELSRSEPITVEQLPAAANNVFMPYAHLSGLPSPKNAQRHVRQFRDIAPRQPDNLMAQLGHALAEVWYGDLAVARTILDRVLVAHPSDAEAQHLSGLCDLRSGGPTRDIAVLERAITAFIAAYEIDNTRFNSLFRYAECCYLVDGDVDEDLVAVLVNTYNLAPQVAFIALTAAQALMLHDRFDEAIHVLRPLAGDIHYPAMARQAEELIVQAQNAQAPVFHFVGSAFVVESDDDEEV